MLFANRIADCKEQEMKRFIVGLTVLLAIGSTGWAQEAKQEVTVQGSGFFTKDTTGDGVTNKPTYSGGFLAGYRFNLNRRFAFEGDYDYFRNAQKFSSNVAQIKTNVNAVTGVAVVKFPKVSIFKPYALAGGGAIIFDPHDAKSIETQARGTFVYGAGADVPLMKRLAFRAQYRGLVYKTPDFGLSGTKTDKFTHSAVPSAGLVFIF
jgi:opacity protein-like surface antigen